MRFLRLLVASLLLAVFGLASRPAHAVGVGSISVAAPTWTNHVGGRPINQINRKDCLDGAVATFSVSIRGVTGGNFEVWSGAGCDVPANRSATAVTKTCVLVATGSYLAKSVDVPVRDMVNAYGGTPPASAATCDLMLGTGLLTRDLFFDIVNPSDLTSLLTMVPKWNFKFDVAAPPAPSAVSAQPGDQTLVTSFTAPTGESNLLRYHFYCSLIGTAPVTTGGAAGTDSGGTTSTAGSAGTDAGGSAGTDAAGGAAAEVGGSAGTAGTSSSAGTAGTAAGTADTAGTTSVTDPNCTSSILVPNQPPPADAIDCGTIPAPGATGGESAPALENDSTYAIAVATEDEVSNVGVLSNLACGTPKDVTGFYEAYRKAGGEGGGGYCTFAPARKGELAVILALGLGACALLRRRR